VHGGQTKTDKVVKMSDEQTATGSSAEQLVDGIIKSVTASIQAANSNCHTTAAAADDDDMVESLTVTISQPAEDTAADIADDVDRPEQLPSEPLSSEPLNIYEFCDDETVSISRHKPSRGPPRSNIELPQSTIELDEDDDNHDLMAFDDDMSPTVDRLAETVVTYSRKKKQPTEQENLADKCHFPDVKATAKKARKQKSSVAGQWRKRHIPEVQEIFEEPVKRKVRKKRTVESNEVNITSEQLEESCLTKCATVTRSGKKPRHIEDDISTKTSLASVDVGDMTVKKWPSERGKKQRRKSKVAEVECRETPAANVSSPGDKTDRVTSRKIQHQKTRTTRHSSLKSADSTDLTSDLLKNDDTSVKTASDDSEKQLTAAAASSHQSSNDDEHNKTSGSSVVEATAAECMSDNTEILSLNDDNDNDDDDEYTRRSSPASYKSEEHEPRVVIPACHDDDDSTGKQHWTLSVQSLSCY